MNIQFWNNWISNSDPPQRGMKKKHSYKQTLKISISVQPSQCKIFESHSLSGLAVKQLSNTKTRMNQWIDSRYHYWFDKYKIIAVSYNSIDVQAVVSISKNKSKQDHNWAFGFVFSCLWHCNHIEKGYYNSLTCFWFPDKSK